MTRKCHNHTLQTNSRHYEGKTQIANSDMTSRKQFKESNQPSPQRDYCKTRKDTYSLFNSSFANFSHMLVANVLIYPLCVETFLASRLYYLIHAHLN